LIKVIVLHRRINDQTKTIDQWAAFDMFE